MAKTLVPLDFKTHLIDQVVESITEDSNTAYYAFVGDHETVASSLDEINQPTDTFNTKNTDVFRNMVFGKRITSTDVSFVVNRNNWVANTVYTMFDDTVVGLQDKNFYVVVDEDSFKHVYKCLSNANGAPSTDKPLFENAKFDADFYETGDHYYQTQDGYQWKYMYSISSAIFDKFATDKYIPIVANNVVSAAAVEGSIDVIRVTTHGKNYLNHLSGQFVAADIGRINRGLIEGDTDGDSSGAGHFDVAKAAQCYRIKSGAEQTADFFKNTIIYITSGTGSGQFKKIEKSTYVADVSGVIVQLEEQFSTLPDETSTYEIFPAVEVTGDGNQTVNAVARAIVNSAASDSIDRVEMLEVGADYSFATATVLTGESKNDDQGVAIVPTSAVVRPIISPPGGHGANTVIELGASRVVFYMKFDGSESGLVEPTNTFAQFGIIRDPQYANVAIYTQNTSGNFLKDETVTSFSKIQLGEVGQFHSNTSLGASIQDKTAAAAEDYDLHFDSGDFIYLETDETTKRYFLTTVGTASTTNTISLAETPHFANSTTINCTAFAVKKQAEGKIKSLSPVLPSGASTGLLLNNAVPEFRKDYDLYGSTSKNVAKIQGVDINNRIGLAESDFQFADFNQMFRITGTTSTGTFTEDEEVFQGTTTAQLYSVESSGGGTTISVTNVTGKLATNSNIEGRSSSAELQGSSSDALDLIPGDLDPNRGSIIYLQNDIPVERNPQQTEEIRVILEF